MIKKTPAPVITTAAVTIAENIVTVSVNDSGQLVGIDNTGAETVLDESRTYAAVSASAERIQYRSESFSFLAQL